MRQMKNSGIEWVGEIPELWIKSKIKYRFKVINGATPSGSNQNFWDGDIAWITPADMPSFGYVDSGKRYITLRGYNSCGTSIVPAGSIIISSRAPIGKVCLSTKALCTNQGCKSLVCCQDNRFCFYFMIAAQEEMGVLGCGTTFMELSTTALENMGIVLPSLSEQKAIAEFLDKKCGEVDALIAEIQQEIETLEQYKRSVITESVTKGLDPSVPMKDSGIQWIGNMPANWECIRGKYILKYLQKPVKKDDGVITCFRDGEVTLRSNRREDGFTMADKEIGYQGVDIGDLVVHGMDGFAGAIGISDSRGKASPVLNVLGTKQNKRYIMYYLRSMAYSDVFMALSTGIRVRSCDLRWNKLAELWYPIPPLKEQEKIVTYIDETIQKANEIIADKQSQIETLESYKKSLIYEYVTGKKEVG